MSQSTLHQVIAVAQGRKARAKKKLTECHRWGIDQTMGIIREYRPLNDEGERLPPEKRLVQLRVEDALLELTDELAGAMDIVATQDYGNQEADAEIVVPGEIAIHAVPVTYMLYLEKQLADLRTFICGLPTLPMDKEWKWDSNRNCYATSPEISMRTQKVPKTHVKFEPTEHQPGQADIIPVDKTVGEWATTHLSGAIREEHRQQMLSRVDAVTEAVKKAREQANATKVDNQDVGGALLKYIFAGFDE